MVMRLRQKGEVPLADLTALGRTALEPPGFATIELLAALEKHLSGGRFLTIEHDGELAFATAVKKARLPFAYLQSWETPLSPAGVPTINAALASTAIETLATSLNMPLLLKQIPVDGQIFDLLHKNFPNFAVMNQWQRAGLKTTGTFENWLQTNFDQKRRKELKRLRTRLGEQGTLVSESLSKASDLESYIADFLRLEANGWKGGKGTALLQDPHLTAALKEALAQLHELGKLRFWRITYDGKAIASLFAFVEGGRATLGKIAYDEDFAKYSPGVLIIIDATAAFFADPAVELADSTAIPGHPMIERIWRDRLPMADIFLGPKPVSSLKFNALVLAQKQRVALRNTIKTMYYRVKGEQAS